MTELTDKECEALDVARAKYVHEGRIVPDLHTVVESIVAARTAALLDRAERAETEYAEAAFAVTQLAALRAAVIAKADQWEKKHHTSPSRERGSGPTLTFAGAATQLRSLLAAAPTETEGENT